MKINYFLTLPIIVVLMVSCSNTKKKSATKQKEIPTIPNYTGPNYEHHKLFEHYKFSSEKEWDSLNKISAHSIPALKHKVSQDYKTFGWHLYSKGSAYKSYNFSLLWGVAYFSYLVNAETGSYDNIHQWKTTALVDSAKAKNCKVFLTVSNFGAKRNGIFLKNPKAQKVLADSLSSLLQYRKADGINLDFEGVSSKNRTEFSDFVILLSKRLRKQNPDYMISLALYAVDYHKVFDISAIDPFIDFYTLMGYDYYGSFSKNAGPVSPLYSSEKWGVYSIEHSVDYYLKEGVTEDKLIVGLPYYGDKWQTENASIPGNVKKFLAHDSYSKIQEQIGKTHNLRFDSISTTRYISSQNKGIFKQVWFDDSLSLSHKYDWVKKKKLAGIGIWALGYDHGHSELWELLADKFGEVK